MDQKPKTEKKIESGCGFENQVPSPKEGKEENFGPTDHMKIQKESQLAEKVEQKQETQDTNVRKCKVDLFKAIFLASDDEEEKGKLQKTVINYEEKVINKERNTSPPRGIFENIKLKLADPEVDNDKDKMRTNTQQYSDTLNSNLHPDLVYGPKIPEKIEASKSRHFYADIADNCLWVEKNSCSKKHKKKDKKMKKSFKSKHKSKKKKSRK